jgi:probable F420-dependent oxidoreductase
MASFALQALPDTAAGWLDTARRAEAAGFDTLLVPDHPGACVAPFVALAAAAAVTSTIRLGSYVANAGVREPLLLAADAATLDVVSGGWALLGVGAGHTPAEWAAVGLERPGVAGRVERCIAVLEATIALLAGEEVTVDRPHLRMTAAQLEAPRPVQERIPVLFGGGNTTLLRWAGAHADIVGLSGLGRTLPDGHRHEIRWRAADIEAQTDVVRGKTIEALVQHLDITDDAEKAIAERFPDTGLPMADLLAAPYLLVGTEDEIVAKVRECERRWGITRFAVRKPALEVLGPLLPRL